MSELLPPPLHAILPEVAAALMARHLVLVTAESCTGGLIAATATELAGSSHWFDRGFVTYSNRSKTDLLGVSQTTLERYGAVSAETVTEMLAGALQDRERTFAIAVSGIAGPGGDSPEKPVGTVFIGWRQSGSPAQVERFQFAGDREAVRTQTVVRAYCGLLGRVSANET